MSAKLDKLKVRAIHRDIETHPAWYGNISGLAADKMLRGRKTPYVFFLRTGEKWSNTTNETNYYVSFLLPDLTIRHQPFTVTVTEEGWYYENTGGGGPYTHESIEDVLHLIMHCQKGECIPLNKLHVK
jgi:hypothetical protein